MPAFRFIYLESDNVEGTAQMVREVISRMQPASPAAESALLSSGGGATSESVNLGKTDSPASSPGSSEKSHSGGPKRHVPQRKPKPIEKSPDRQSPARRQAAVTNVHSEQRESRVEASIAYLRKNGPSRKSHIAKACGFTPVYATGLFRDERFEEVDGGLVWIAGEDVPGSDDEEDESDEDDEEDPPPPPAPKPPPPKRSGPPTVAELIAIIRKEGPMNAAEVASKSRATHAACHHILQDDAFEFSEGLYWVK
jgi:hypothetical protein